MKLTALFLTLTSLFSTQALAQGFGLPGRQPLVVTCNFGKAFHPSAKMAEVTGSKNPVAHCVGSDSEFEIAFSGVNFKTESGEFAKNPVIELRCTTQYASGIYVYGGLPIGFQTKNSPKSPVFYNVDTENTGRCFLEYNHNVISGISATVKESKMVLLELGGGEAE